MDVFINAAEAITAQNTFGADDFLLEISESKNGYFSVIEPNYKEYISPKQLRRMSKIIKMGVSCGLKVLHSGEIEQPDAIIIGTGLGCLTDTIKFLDNMIENNEMLLNPTAFIQSIHNTISGQIALLLSCQNYNFTFSQQSVSFETALVDAYIKLQEKDITNILLGGLDEINDRTFNYYKAMGCVKNYVPGEGASFFLLSNEKSDKNIAKIKGSTNFEFITENKIPKDLNKILLQNDISIKDINIVISGENSKDINKKEYKKVKNLFENSKIIKYKDIVGEYDTVTGFAMWLATKIIEKQIVPSALLSDGVMDNPIENVLIHNYSNAHNHSFILLSKC